MNSQCPPWIDPAWWEIYGPRISRGASQASWLTTLATAWRLIRTPAVLTAAELVEQEEVAAYAIGLKFRTTQVIHHVW